MEFVYTVTPVKPLSVTNKDNKLNYTDPQKNAKGKFKTHAVSLCFSKLYLTLKAS